MKKKEIKPKKRKYDDLIEEKEENYGMKVGIKEEYITLDQLDQPKFSRKKIENESKVSKSSIKNKKNTESKKKQNSKNKEKNKKIEEDIEMKDETRKNSSNNISLKKEK